MDGKIKNKWHLENECFGFAFEFDNNILFQVVEWRQKGWVTPKKFTSSWFQFQCDNRIVDAGINVQFFVEIIALDIIIGHLIAHQLVFEVNPAWHDFKFVQVGPGNFGKFSKNWKSL